MKKLYTHTGIVSGADARTSKDYKKQVFLRKTKNYWITPQGSRYKNYGFVGRGVGDWPMYQLVEETIEPLREPVRI